MPQLHRLASKPALAATTLLLVLAGLALGACGGSSSAGTTSTNASATAPNGAAGAPAFAKRFAERRACLQKLGITLPTPTPGQRQRRTPGTGGGFFGGRGGGVKLPSGVTRAQLEAAVKKCGGFARGGAGAGFNSPQARQALAKFAACMNENGVKLPAPNTSGSGPAFNTKGIDTSSATFQAAEAKCRADIRSVFPARPGSGTGAGAPGAPPSAG